MNHLLHGLALPFAHDCLDPAPLGMPADIRIEERPIPRTLPSPAITDPQFDAQPGQFLYRGGQRSARFLVEGGTSIGFERNAECEPALFLHHLLHPVMAAVLRQRGLLVLHASTVISPEGAVLIAGDAGAGKSTTVAALAARGWVLQSDDVTALRLADGRLEALPGTRRVYLYEDSATRLGIDTAGLPRNPLRRRKAAVALQTEGVRTPSPVTRIVHLRNGPVPEPCIERLAGRAKLAMLQAALYGPLLAEEAAAALEVRTRALDIKMVSVTRPAHGWSLDDVVEAIANG